MAKDKKTRVLRRLDDIIDNFAKSPNPPAEPVAKKVEPIKEKDIKPLDIPQEEPKKEKPKPESINGVKKRMKEILDKHIESLPEKSRLVSAKDIKQWILQNPGINVNSPEFLNWYRSPDGESPNACVKRFGELLLALGIDHQCDVEIKGYVYDYFIPPMSLYVDIDPISLELDDPKTKITITIDKNKIDIADIWRKINNTREQRCKPYRFISIKERLYAEDVKDFLDQYEEWYCQKMINESVR